MTNIKSDESKERLLNSKKANRLFLLEEVKTVLRMSRTEILKVDMGLKVI